MLVAGISGQPFGQAPLSAARAQQTEGSWKPGPDRLNVGLQSYRERNQTNLRFQTMRGDP